MVICKESLINNELTINQRFLKRFGVRAGIVGVQTRVQTHLLATVSFSFCVYSTARSYAASGTFFCSSLASSVASSCAVCADGAGLGGVNAGVASAGVCCCNAAACAYSNCCLTASGCASEMCLCCRLATSCDCRYAVVLLSPSMLRAFAMRASAVPKRLSTMA